VYWLRNGLIASSLKDVQVNAAINIPSLWATAMWKTKKHFQSRQAVLWSLRLSYRAVIKGLEQLSVGPETEKPLQWGLRNNTLLLCFSVGSNNGHIFTLSRMSAGIQRLGQCIASLERAVQRGREVCVRVFEATWCFWHFTFTLPVVTQCKHESNG